ncbi:hypothetical protein TTHERM_00191070 (macronuclear) [Tetrahymena thermophila SB210]|uniref:Uncharacterized protein n=1 Tax=Tetrahymena thermophila (strain SB210) TaxID=312017 RepID=I7MJL9_TETTS|nr:hypothetical protein TTHERM_00191070 [Tetrahymena thermophila SB210]EAR96439.2 hypothetical protein TTHERM_00191070 [Tetrahymena thermophila SB210]|eukprot:XP_001016684.2 hypothetical protein TTHERM_00191070 [Tetrahymena thermophila SB210]
MTMSPQLFFCFIVAKISIESSLKRRNERKQQITIQMKNSGIRMKRYYYSTMNGENNKINKKKKKAKKNKKKQYFFTEITSFADIEEKTKVATNETDDKDSVRK